jgi:sugar phosphate isomerase/epimerase
LETFRLTLAAPAARLAHMISPSLSRRHFLGTVASAALAAPLTGLAAPAKDGSRFRLMTFSKPFQDVGYDRTGEIVAEIGWAGIECPVRKKGQVLPEQVEEELPKLHAALAKRKVTIDLVTTDIGKVDPLAERVLRAASKLGVKRYRLTFEKYDLEKPIPPQLANLKAQLRDLAALNKQLGIKGGIQNHSGRNYVGAPIWDIYELIHDIDPEHLGICFDIGHATLEGGTSWPIEAKLMEPLLTCVYVKDFYWQKGPKGWAAKWGPLGEGMVRQEFFDWLKTSSYQGPISQHCEYLHGDGPEQMAAMKKDCDLLKSWLA